MVKMKRTDGVIVEFDDVLKIDEYISKGWELKKLSKKEKNFYELNKEIDKVQDIKKLDKLIKKIEKIKLNKKDKEYLEIKTNYIRDVFIDIFFSEEESLKRFFDSVKDIIIDELKGKIKINKKDLTIEEEPLEEGAEIFYKDIPIGFYCFRHTEFEEYDYESEVYPEELTVLDAIVEGIENVDIQKILHSQFRPPFIPPYEGIERIRKDQYERDVRRKSSLEKKKKESRRKRSSKRSSKRRERSKWRGRESQWRTRPGSGRIMSRRGKRDKKKKRDSRRDRRKR